MKRSLALATLSLLASGHAFVAPSGSKNGSLELQASNGNNSNHYNLEGSDRRGFLGTAFGIGFSTMVSFNTPAFAAKLSQDDIDKQNVVKGYLRLQYLLDNWEAETTICGMGGDKLERSCDRTPLKVMDYMGYKSTTDPLYKAEKTLRRLYENAPAKRDSEFIEAVEVFAENADEASGMAFVSSWGEANPGEL